MKHNFDKEIEEFEARDRRKKFWQDIKVTVYIGGATIIIILIISAIMNNIR